MALFGKGKTKKDDAPEADAPAFVPNPDSARKFFQHAQTAHDSTNFAYAVTLWLQGIGKDPATMDGLEKFFQSASKFLASNAKQKGPTKEQRSNFTGKDSVSKYQAALLEWGTNPGVWQSGLKATRLAIELGLDEQAYWLGERVVQLAMGDPKAKKDTFVTLMRLFAQIGGFKIALACGERARNMDPSDGKLEAEVKNMGAEDAMSAGGYQKSGEQGGFRENIRDADKQRKMEASERVVKGEADLDREIEDAIADHNSRPEDGAAGQKLGKLLATRGTPEDIKAAIAIYSKMHKVTGQYNFRMLAGDLQMRVGRKKLRALIEQAKANPDNTDLAAKVAAGRQQILEFEITQFRERCDNYPTNLKLRYELGRRLLDAERHDEAIAQLQDARGATGLGPQIYEGLGRAFAHRGYMVEAIDAYRNAIAEHPTDTDDLAIELRYGLMVALETTAADNADLHEAEEAFGLAAWIAGRKFGFRDIAEHREKLQLLVRELRQKAS